jgi:hypothetical protein
VVVGRGRGWQKTISFPPMEGAPAANEMLLV